jgi:RluA family pseudouridine synthase
VRALTDAEVDAVRAWVIFEDGALLALNKPAGLSVQGGRGQVTTLDDMLVAFARSNGKRPHLVHRLDRDTSGVILAAKTKPAAGSLGKQIMARQVKKTYLALVAPGAPEPKAGIIEAPLRRVEQGREAYMRVCEAEHPDAEAAATRYRTLAEAPGVALMEMSPVTGRMHQIRVHLAHLGRPILGDARYGGALMLAGAPVPRLMLHAEALEFRHPDSGKMLRLTADPPQDFASLCERAGLAITAP